MTGTTNTIRLYRVLRAPVDRVFKAFVDPDAKCRWLPPNGYTCKVHHFTPIVGGTYKMSFTNFSTGNSHSWTGRFVEIVPNERITYIDRFDDPNLPGEMTVTVTMCQVLCGTELSIVQEGVPAVIPPEMCYVGWQESLCSLARLVEPEIPDGV